MMMHYPDKFSNIVDTFLKSWQLGRYDKALVIETNYLLSNICFDIWNIIIFYLIYNIYLERSV